MSLYPTTRLSDYPTRLARPSGWARPDCSMGDQRAGGIAGAGEWPGLLDFYEIVPLQCHISGVVVRQR